MISYIHLNIYAIFILIVFLSICIYLWISDKKYMKIMNNINENHRLQNIRETTSICDMKNPLFHSIILYKIDMIIIQHYRILQKYESPMMPKFSQDHTYILSFMEKNKIPNFNNISHYKTVEERKYIMASLDAILEMQMYMI